MILLFHCYITSDSLVYPFDVCDASGYTYFKCALGRSRALPTFNALELCFKSDTSYLFISECVNIFQNSKTVLNTLWSWSHTFSLTHLSSLELYLNQIFRISSAALS